MSETKKFTKEELDQIEKLREANSQKIHEFGQLELELLLTSQRLNALEDFKNKAKEDFMNLQKQEQELVQKLNEKYGAGTVDLTNGEFIPSN
jgi:hypothetical protein